jgi:hypothetical protein
MSGKAVAVLVFLLCAAGGALALANGGGSGEKPRRAAASTDAGKPLDVALKPAHGSGVSGTARLVPGPDGVKVTLSLSKRVSATLPAHIHTGPCSDEPTFRNPRIWVGLTEVIDGRSETTITLATVPELQSESSSINVHDVHHNLRPLVCGDIPPGS